MIQILKGVFILERIEFTVNLVKEAGALIREMIKNETSIEVETKANDSDFVTNVDKQTEVYLVEAIKKKYKHQDFLTEENTTVREVSDDLWIVDPIDGTTNFIFQKKNFGISVAFYHKRKPVFGIVYDVMEDKLFLGISGKGAYLNGVRMKSTNQEIGLKQSLMYGDLYSLTMFPKGLMHLREQLVSHRYLGAASLEICAVAENQAEAYISRNLKVWDIAAGVIILKEAGGTFFFGGHDNDIYFNDEDGVFISAQNKTIKSDIKSNIESELLEEVIN